jgi:hypothetical protein
MLTRWYAAPPMTTEPVVLNGDVALCTVSANGSPPSASIARRLRSPNR